jgi:hypothetical protein
MSAASFSKVVRAQGPSSATSQYPDLVTPHLEKTVWCHCLQSRLDAEVMPELGALSYAVLRRASLRCRILWLVEDR